MSDQQMESKAKSVHSLNSLMTHQRLPAVYCPATEL